jgi:hypothetical protein
MLHAKARGVLNEPDPTRARSTRDELIVDAAYLCCSTI